MSEESLGRQLYQAIHARDVKKAEALLKDCGDLTKERFLGKSWLSHAGKQNSVPLLKLFLDRGWSAARIEGERYPPLYWVTDSGSPEIVSLLFQYGADPNDSRAVLGLANRVDGKAVELMQLFVKHGLDVNRLYDLEDIPDSEFTILDATETPELKTYLRSVGAKTYEELSLGPHPPTTVGGVVAAEASKELLRFGFEEKLVGKSIGKIGFLQMLMAPFARGGAIVISQGLATKVKAGGEEGNAPPIELYVHLSADWLKLRGPHRDWPLKCLGLLAKSLLAGECELGSPITILEVDPIGDSESISPYAGWMLAEDRAVNTSDRGEVNFFRMLPLFKEEITLERKFGLPRLMKGLDRSGVDWVVRPVRQVAVDR